MRSLEERKEEKPRERYALKLMGAALAERRWEAPWLSNGGQLRVTNVEVKRRKGSNARRKGD